VASPMMPQTPTPRPPHRSIAGPVILILMGILFLMGTMRIMDIHHLGSLFARFWPALLILWGALKLIEYEQAKRYGQPVRGIGVGGVFLLLFLNCFDHGCEQFAVGNPIGAIGVVLPFDQRQPVLSFRSLDGVLQRCRQGLFDVLRDKAKALGLVAIVEAIGYRPQLGDEVEAEIGR